MAAFLRFHLQNGKYSIIEQIGQGGFGVTYKATLSALRQTVVVKTLNPTLRADPEFAQFQQQFQSEAQRLALCAHPNIVRVIDFFIERNLPFIVMEYIPGYTLEQLIEQGGYFPETVALGYIMQIAKALKQVHRNGLLHRDVKPQNIILKHGTHKVILIDFGIAREFFPGRTQTQTAFVTPGYAPIEQYLPSQARTAAIDVYGLAATLYTLLTGEIPVPSILRDHQRLPDPREYQNVSPNVTQALLWGMAVDPQDRPPSIDAWIRQLLNPQEINDDRRARTQVVLPKTLPQTEIDSTKPKKSFSFLLTILGITVLSALSLGTYLLFSQPSTLEKPDPPEETPSPTPELAPKPKPSLAPLNLDSRRSVAAPRTKAALKSKLLPPQFSTQTPKASPPQNRLLHQ